MNQISPIRPVGPASDDGFDEAVARMAPIDRLMADKDALRARYLAAKPFPHLVIDNVFDPAVLDRVAAEFPARGGRDWLSYDTANEIKQTSRGAIDLPAFSQTFLWQMCAPPMMRFLREVTGHADLCVDPLFHGGGMHESFRGGWLNMHADWTQHPVLPLTRRLNLIVYLNRDWDPAWGGALELKNPVDDGIVAKVEPVFNRAVIFPTTAETLHGFPDPMACPADRSRTRSRKARPSLSCPATGKPGCGRSCAPSSRPWPSRRATASRRCCAARAARPRADTSGPNR
jgi:2OG-Fe(II) oxygenase superfamily